MSGDTDLTAPVAAVRRRLHKPIAVFNPHDGECTALRNAASYYAVIDRELPDRCQLPPVVVVAGKSIRAPDGWTSR